MTIANSRSSSDGGVSTTRLEEAAGLALPIIERLRRTLDDEIGGIQSGIAVDYTAFNLAKNQALLELSRLAPALQRLKPGVTLRMAIVSLRNTLEKSERILRIQLRAAQEISEMIAQSIQDCQSDGTYSARVWRD